MFILYKRFKGKLSCRREDLEAHNHDLGEEDEKLKQMFDNEKGSRAGEDSSLPDEVVLSPLITSPAVPV